MHPGPGSKWKQAIKKLFRAKSRSALKCRSPSLEEVKISRALSSAIKRSKLNLDPGREWFYSPQQAGLMRVTIPSLCITLAL